MKRGTTLTLLLGMLPVLSGCGTLGNMQEVRDAEQPGRTPYGGVRDDACGGFRMLSTVVHVPDSEEPWEFGQRAACLVLGTYFLAVDLPMSAIADTVTLPYVLLAGPGTIPKPDAHPTSGAADN